MVKAHSDAVVVAWPSRPAPVVFEPDNDDGSGELEIEALFSARISGLRRMPRHERAQALRAARLWRQQALRALREKRASCRRAHRDAHWQRIASMRGP
jgi:hypothetical protein